MAVDVDELRQQLVEVQSHIAFQDDTVQALNDALALEQQGILLLRRQQEMLKQRQDEQAAVADAGDAGGPADEKPPHY
jgi:SlyX protein